MFLFYTWTEISYASVVTHYFQGFRNMAENELYRLGSSEYTLFTILFYVLPFALEIRMLEPERFENTLWSFGYWIVFSRRGIEYAAPYWSLSSTFWVFLYYMGLQLAFVYFLRRYYNGESSKRTTLLVGIISVLPGWLPFVTGAILVFLILPASFSFLLLLTIPLPAVFGFWLLWSKPKPVQEEWIEENQIEQWIEDD